MSVLVTGGAGYIGSATVRRLRSDGTDVVVLDSLEFGTPASIPGVDLVVADIADVEAVTSVCKEHQVTQAVHFAAYKSVGESMEQPTRYFANNVGGTVTLVDTLLANGVTDLVFSSSCSVNGTPATNPVDEQAPIHPESVYAETKAIVERILGWYDVTRGLRSICLRYFNAAGASPDGRFGETWDHSANLVPLTMKAVLGRSPQLQVFGDDYPTPDGTCIRDYVHVDDLADAHVKALAHLAGGGATDTINVGTGVGSSVLDVIHATERISGRPVPYEIVARRPGDPVATFADPTRSADVLGWRAIRTLEDIIASAWAWHHAHPDGYRDVG